MNRYRDSAIARWPLLTRHPGNFPVILNPHVHGLWTPANINTVFVVNGADAETITAPAGVVSAWRDTSVGGRHATQSVEDSKPTWNGSGIVFDGSNDFMTSPTSKSLFSSTITVALAFEPTDRTQTKIFLSLATTAQAPMPWLAIQQNQGTVRAYVNGQYRLSKTLSAQSSRFVFTLQYTGTQWLARLNGESAVAYTGPIGTMSGTSLYLASGYAGTWAGSLYDVVISPDVVDIYKLEGCLAWRRGITLPAEHPYAAGPPLA